MVVTQRGIAVNTSIEKNRQLEEALKAKGLPVVDIKELKAIGEKITGVPKPIKQGDKVIAKVLYRDGTLLDEIHQVAGE